MDRKKPRKPSFRVRPISREDRFKKVRALQCFKEVHERLIQGWSVPEVARFIQEDCQEYLDVTRDSLIGIINEYRGSLPKGELIAQRMPQVFMKAAHEIEERLDELTELERLYKLQMRRIEIDFKNEQKIQKLMPTMTQEMRVAKEILGEMAQLKMDLGIEKRHLGQVDVDARLLADVAERYAGRESVAKVINDPQSRRRVLGLAERLLGASDGLMEEAELVEKLPSTSPEIQVTPVGREDVEEEDESMEAGE